MPGKSGTTKARVHPVFTKRLDDLRANAAAAVQALTGAGVRQWQVPADYTGDLLDVPKLHKPSFDREEINTNYKEVMQDPANPGTVGDVIGLKSQMDNVATEERAFRIRHSSVVRSFVHAGGRRYGQANGRMFDNIQDQAAKMILAGGAAGPATAAAGSGVSLPDDGSPPRFTNEIA